MKKGTNLNVPIVDYMPEVFDALRGMRGWVIIAVTIGFSLVSQVFSDTEDSLNLMLFLFFFIILLQLWIMWGYTQKVDRENSWQKGAFVPMIPYFTAALLGLCYKFIAPWQFAKMLTDHYISAMLRVRITGNWTAKSVLLPCAAYLLIYLGCYTYGYVAGAKRLKKLKDWKKDN